MDRLFQVFNEGQILIVNEEGLRTLCPGINIQCFTVANNIDSQRVPNTVIEKQNIIEGNSLQQQCISEPMDVTESVSDTHQTAIVSTVQIPVLLGRPIQGQQTILTPITTPNNISSPNKTEQLKIGSNEILTSINAKVLTGEVNGVNDSVSSKAPNEQISIISPSKSDITQLVVVTPDGLERIITVNEAPEKIDIQKVLEEVGIDDTVEAVIGNPEKSTETSKIDSKELVLTTNSVTEGSSMILSGKLAVCHQCGYLSQDFIKCQRCRRKLPPNVRIVPISQSPKKENKPEFNPDIKKEKRRCIRRTRKPEEPICLTISSDEEDNRVDHRNKGDSNENQRSEPSVKDTVKEKEPIITESTEPPEDSLTLGVAGGGMDISELVDSPDVENALLQCRTVRIGSYKVVPTDKVLLTEYGLKIQVPSVKGDPTMIKILRPDIIKVLVHFGKTLPVLFYYITAKAAKKIRVTLQMPNKENNTYFDPTSSEEMHKRITLLPEKITEETRLFIKSIYEPKGCLGELNANEANTILVRAAPKDVQHHLKKDTLQSSCHPIQTIMVYPPPPTKGGIPINTEDYACLGEDQFLNDVIIDFYLQYLLQTVLSEEDQKRTHVFSSFFYKRLTTRATPQTGSGVKSIEDPKMSPAEKRHARVKGWTKSVDLFSKDFVIIPINENSHWFLGIICFPGLTTSVKMSDNTPVPSEERKKPKEKPKCEIKEGTVLTGGQAPATIGATTITVVQSSGATITLEADDEDRDEADGDDEDLEPNTSDEEEAKDSSEGDLMDEATPKATKPQKPQQEPIKQPCILIFDSLAGASRSRVYATLRDYLRVEYKVRHKNSSRDFSKDELKGAVPKVPQQTNFTDCGLYVLQYVESFFQKPLTDYRMPIKQLKDWFTPDVVSRKRYEIQQLLHRLMEDQGIEVARLNLPFLGLKDESKSSLADYSESEEENEESEEDLKGELADTSAASQESKLFDGVFTSQNLTEEETGMEEMGEEEESDFDSEEIDEEGGDWHQSQNIFCEESPLKRKSAVSLKQVRHPRLVKANANVGSNCKKMRCDD